jgi:hypothetical protein
LIGSSKLCPSFTCELHKREIGLLGSVFFEGLQHSLLELMHIIYEDSGSRKLALRSVKADLSNYCSERKNFEICANRIGNFSLFVV